MSVAVLNNPEQSSLRGAQGELVLVRIAVEARQLEEVLEAVAELPFPVNPEIYHQGVGSIVEFPAYSDRVDDVHAAFLARGLSCASITHRTVNGDLSA